jgi:hypothetical protein
MAFWKLYSSSQLCARILFMEAAMYPDLKHRAFLSTGESKQGKPPPTSHSHSQSRSRPSHLAPSDRATISTSFTSFCVTTTTIRTITICILASIPKRGSILPLACYYANVMRICWLYHRTFFLIFIYCYIGRSGNADTFLWLSR